MNHGMMRWGSVVGLTMIAIGCGGSPKGAASASGATATGASTPASAAADGADGGGALDSGDATNAAGASGAGSAASAPQASAPPAHPFANNAVEATSLIDDAINSRANEIMQCVDAARERRKTPHAKLIVEVGIDQEGHMLGVKLPKGEKADKTFVDCVLAALNGAPFPRSHAGVITVRKTFEDKQVVR